MAGLRGVNPVSPRCYADENDPWKSGNGKVAVRFSSGAWLATVGKESSVSPLKSNT